MGFSEPLPPIDQTHVPKAHPFASAWDKFNRAIEHHAELNRVALQLLPLTTENHHLEVVQESPRKARLIARLPNVPARFACVLGDIVHCLRTALDHAAWALAKRHGFSGSARLVFFPLFDRPEKFAAKRASLERLFGAPAVERLEGLQPYRDRDGLRWLHDLDLVDKHEAIVIINHRFHIEKVEIHDAKGRRPLSASADPPGPIDLQDGDTFFTLEHDNPLSGVSLKAEVQNTFALQADPARSWPQDRADWVVRECFHHVEECLRALGSWVEPPKEEDTPP